MNFLHIDLSGSLLQSATALLQSATDYFITKCDSLSLQNATAILLQSASNGITKCDNLGYVHTVPDEFSAGSNFCAVRCSVHMEPPNRTKIQVPSRLNGKIGEEFLAGTVNNLTDAV